MNSNFCDHGARSTNSAATGIASEAPSDAGVSGSVRLCRYTIRYDSLAIATPATASAHRYPIAGVLSAQAPMNLVTIPQNGAGFS